MSVRHVDTDWPLQCLCGTALGESLQCGGCGAAYERIEGTPVLIDFERSIVSRDAILANSPDEELASAGRVGTLLRRIGYGATSGMMQAFEQALAGLREDGNDPEVRVLILGGGTKGPEEDRLEQVSHYRLLRADIYHGRDVDIICDGHDLPFPDGSFDAILCQAVLEHVLVPQRVVDEMHRVLRSGGLVAAGTPFLQPVHMGAYDFTRFTMSGHRWLFRQYEEIDAGVRGGPGLSAIWAIGLMARGLVGRKLAAIVAALLGWLNWLDRLLSRQVLEDGANGVWFVGRKRDGSMKPAEMIAYYQGRHAKRA